MKILLILGAVLLLQACGRTKVEPYEVCFGDTVVIVYEEGVLAHDHYVRFKTGDYAYVSRHKLKPLYYCDPVKE